MSNTHKYITVAYKLYAMDEEGKKHLVEEAKEERPFCFISGFGTTLEAFEKNIESLNTGNDFDFSLTVEEGYGEYDESHVVELGREVFTINNHFDHEHIYKGAVVPLQNEDGNHFLGQVLEVTTEKVKIDLNHPLAGKALNFTGHVIESRDATEEEIQGLIRHMSGEGCGCGCCGNDQHHEGSCCCGHHEDGNGCDHHHGEGCGCAH